MEDKNPVQSIWQIYRVLQPFSSATVPEVHEVRRNICCSSRESLKCHNFIEDIFIKKNKPNTSNHVYTISLQWQVSRIRN